MKPGHGPRSAGRYVGAIHRFAQRHFAAEMERLGLPATAFPLIMRLLRRDGSSQDELADDFLVDKATAARTVARLEEAGFVTRVVDEADKRIKRVYVTDRAREREREVHAAAEAWSEMLLDGFTAEERQATVEYLQRMADNARRHWGDVPHAPCGGAREPDAEK